MSTHEIASWLVTYDIANKRRLVRVFKCLKREGIPLQYSVFMVEATNAKMGALIAKIATIINAKEDDVRSYRLPQKGWNVTMGRSILPDDIWMS